MKYIRTKDGRIIKWNDSIFIDNDIPQGESYKSCNGVYYLSKKDILNQADTIEELCERFVVDVPNDRKFNREFDLDKSKKYQLYLKCQNIFSEIYGAFWTDKGLIYVAKMNDKGELELL